jgi:transposase-like protein
MARHRRFSFEFKRQVVLDVVRRRIICESFSVICE